MSKIMPVYDILISCPSDVAEYIEILEREIISFNNSYGRYNDIVLRTLHWSKNMFPQFGDRPQELINKQLVDLSDMAIGVFWTRFGTPTETYGSGTEEEIERLMKDGKQVFLYFLDKPIAPSQIDHDQYYKVHTFREKHQKDGIYFIVQDEQALQRKFRENLELYFDSILKGKTFREMNNEKKILWVDDCPENNMFIRKLLETSYGLEIVLALSTKQALKLMEYEMFSLIISDMGRKEGDKEGYLLLDKVRQIDKAIPFIIYASSYKEAFLKETQRRGGQGNTNNPSKLIDLVIRNLLKR